MKNWNLRWLSVLLAACMLLAMPAAMMEEALPEAMLADAEAPETADEVVEAPVEEAVAEIGEFAEEEAVIHEAQNADISDWTGPIHDIHSTETRVNVDPEMRILFYPDHEGVLERCTSSNESIATVDEIGVVTTYKKLGETRIELAYEDGAVYVVKLTVIDPTIPRNIELHLFYNQVIEKGASLTVDYSVHPRQAPQTVKWTTSDKTVATVSKKGVVKGVKAGTVTITATAPTGKNVKASFYLKVIDPDSPAEKGISINKTNFPNAVFREFVRFHFDVNNDEKLSDAEIAAVKAMEVNGRFLDRDALTSLKGIERFTALESLEFANLPKLKSVDLSGNVALKELSASDDDALASLNLSKNIELTLVDLHNDPKLKTLNVIGCKQLTRLEVCWCALTSLNVKNNTKLETLICWDNAIKTLDISKCPELVELVKTVKPEFGDDTIGFELDDDHVLFFDSDVTLKGATVPAVITVSKSATSNAYIGIPVWVELDGAQAKSFKSSKTAVATVNKSTGLVTPKKAGAAKITITPKKGSKVVVTLKVASPTDPIGVSIKQGAKKTLAVKKTLQLTATLKAIDGYTAETTLTWTSDNTAVAKVNKSTGKVTAVKKGKVNITVKTKNGHTATIAITVK